MNKKSIGSRNKDSVFSAIDLTPSLLQLTGAQAPKGVKYDGENVLDTLLGKSTASRSQPIFFRRPPDRKAFYEFKELPDLAVRDKQWKLLCNYDGSGAQLYDLTVDVGEKNNLAKEKPEIVSRLSKQLIAWHQSMPEDNGATFRLKKKKKK